MNVHTYLTIILMHWFCCISSRNMQKEIDRRFQVEVARYQKPQYRHKMFIYDAPMISRCEHFTRNTFNNFSRVKSASRFSFYFGEQDFNRFRIKVDRRTILYTMFTLNDKRFKRHFRSFLAREIHFQPIISTKKQIIQMRFYLFCRVNPDEKWRTSQELL